MERFKSLQRRGWVFAPITMLLASLAILAGCQTTQESAAPAATSTAPEQWVGTWSGAWLDGGNCPSTITVKDVTGTTAVATYTWGSGCGGSAPGEHTDTQAKLLGNNLEVALKFGYRARYTMRDDGDLNGVWSSRGGEHSARATFYRE